MASLRAESLTQCHRDSKYSSRDESVCSAFVRNKRQGIRDVEVATDKEAYTVHTTNIISHRQYFVARCLSSYIGNVFGLHSICVRFLSTRKLVS
jgi:hypothetical protein